MVTPLGCRRLDEYSKGSWKSFKPSLNYNTWRIREEANSQRQQSKQCTLNHSFSFIFLSSTSRPGDNCSCESSQWSFEFFCNFSYGRILGNSKKICLSQCSYFYCFLSLKATDLKLKSVKYQSHKVLTSRLGTKHLGVASYKCRMPCNVRFA